MRKSHIAILALMLLMALLINVPAPSTAQEAPTGGNPLDLKNPDQDGVYVFYDAPAGASTTGKPVDVGDFDGNGCGDIAITGQNSSHPVGGTWRGSGGHIRIVMNLCDIGGQLAIENVPPDKVVFTIFGAVAGDMAGTETYVADFNNDGYDDLLFSAQNSDGPGASRSNAGAFYVLFGEPLFALRTDIDLAQPTPNLLTVYGATREDRLGLWVEGGDFDGDGFHDVLVGANQADGVNDQRINAGEIWIIYGAEDMITKYGDTIDLREPPSDATRIIGADYDDLFGSCVWGDDLNGDGYADAIVSAGLWRASSGVGGLSFGGADGPANSRYNSGETFVVFGKPELRGQTIDLADTIDENGWPVDDSVTVIYGPDANDLLGEEIAVADIDGDGLNDLVLGTLIGDGPENNMDEAGEAWVIYTHAPFVGQAIDLANVRPDRAVVIYPDQPDSKAGDTIRAGDLNGDGFAEIFYGAPDYDPVGYDGLVRRNAGLMAVIFGQDGGLPNNNGRIDIFDAPPDLQILYIIGADDNDMMPYSLDIEDMDGDGIIDIIPNAMGGDGVTNNQTNAGEIYVISGAAFLQADPSVDVVTAPEPTATTRPTATPLPDATVEPSETGDAERGQVLYEETCAGCHGIDGEGVPGLGLPLATSPLVVYAPDLELLLFLRVGRPADHPDNSLGVSMPAAGGRTDWGTQEFNDIIAYLRVLRDQWEE